MTANGSPTSVSFTLILKNILVFLLLAQCSFAEPINAIYRRAEPIHSPAKELQVRQPPPDPPIPVIDGVPSTKRYIKAPPVNQGAFWSGIPFPLSQSAAAAAGLQTLEQSVPPEITNHPEGQRGTPTNPQFWDWFSEGFSDTIVEGGSTSVTVLLRAPNRLLTGPSNPLEDGRMVSRSNWSEIEFPIMQRNRITVMAMHPGENGRPGIDRYQIWPNDEGYLWQQRWQGGEETSTQLQCPPGDNAVLVQCETPQDPDTFEVGCPDVPGTLEPPVAGGQCNYTVTPPANPDASNTFDITYVLTTAAVKLLLSCMPTTCPPKAKRSEAGLNSAQRALIKEAISVGTTSELGKAILYNATLAA